MDNNEKDEGFKLEEKHKNLLFRALDKTFELGGNLAVKIMTFIQLGLSAVFAIGLCAEMAPLFQRFISIDFIAYTAAFIVNFIICYFIISILIFFAKWF
ncbi:MAG: hypothetical protein J0G32_02445 [Alphaproteobacteria bacterium]|nr:hypothetical protein [Alphaproteobacteria bacterium]OJV12188.1 MAG: hypothetical protein BGO27_05560 [Alphaproteobacteria bacterium 33-17]